MLKKKEFKDRSLRIFPLVIILILLLVMLLVTLSFFPKSLTGFAIYSIPVSSQNFIKSDISASTPYNSLMLYYPFDTDNTQAIDFSTNANHGMYSGAGVSSNCFFLNCSSFNGKDSSISVNNPEKVNLSANFTISAWIKKSGDNNDIAILTKSDANWWVFGGKRLFLLNDKLSFDSAGIGSISSGTTIIHEVWYHIAVTHSFPDNTTTLYINGNSDGSSIINFPADVPGHVVRIGSLVNNFYFNGSMDELMLFNSTLSPAQISSIYTNQSQRFINSSYLYAKEISSGNDKVNISIGNIIPSGTSVDVNLNFFNGTWNNAGTQQLSSTNTFNISLFSTNITINLTLKPDAQGFFSPILLGNINLKVNPFDTQAPIISFEDPSTYSGLNAQTYIEVNISANDTFLNRINIVLRNSTGILNLSTSGISPYYIRFDNLPYNSYTVIATANDTYGNSETLSRSIDLVATLPAPIITGSTSVLSEIDLSLGTIKAMNINDKLKFNITDIYFLTLTSFNNQTSISTISITGQPSPISLLLGESKKINLNNDNYYEVIVKFESISNNKPQISVKKISEFIPTPLSNQSVIAPNMGGNPPSNTIVPPGSTNKNFSFNRDTIWLIITSIIVFGIIVIIIAISIVIIKNLKKKNEEIPTSANLSRKLDTLMRDI